MFSYKVIVGTVDPAGNGSPRFFLEVEEQPKTLEAVFNGLAREGWKPWHFSIPTAYRVVRDKIEEAPVTLIFRREEPNAEQ